MSFWRRNERATTPPRSGLTPTLEGREADLAALVTALRPLTAIPLPSGGDTSYAHRPRSTRGRKPTPTPLRAVQAAARLPGREGTSNLGVTRADVSAMSDAPRDELPEALGRTRAPVEKLCRLVGR